MTKLQTYERPNELERSRSHELQLRGFSLRALASHLWNSLGAWTQWRPARSCAEWPSCCTVNKDAPETAANKKFPVMNCKILYPKTCPEQKGTKMNKVHQRMVPSVERTWQWKIHQRFTRFLLPGSFNTYRASTSNASCDLERLRHL